MKRAVSSKSLAAERDRERPCALCEAHEARAEAAERSYREAVATISHDVKNPLSVIFVSTRLLLKALGPGAQGRRHIDTIARAAEDINQIAQDLVDATLIERGALLVEREPQEIPQIVDTALEAVKHAATTRPVDITAKLAAGLPPVAGERERLVHVVTRLLANAIRFASRGGRVTLRAKLAGSHVAFSIADTGPGLPADQRAHLSAARPPAKGLTLYVVKGTIEAHGGKIWVRNRVGGGTLVHFTIPVA